MTPSKLESFIAHARQKGMDHQTINMLLRSAGWKESDIVAALSHESLGMEVPAPPDVGSARDAFFHLLAFTTLYSTVISLIILLFQFINRWLPDVADPMYYANTDISGIRWSIAIIVVSFPIFLWLARILQREFRAHPEKLLSGVRRWLTYLTLFVTACTLIGDVITLLFYLLDGEVSTRFVLKVIVILVASGMPFTYYLRALRMEPQEYVKSGIHKAYISVASVITILAVLYGIFVVGSPSYGRQERLDESRVGDLRTIENSIIDYTYGQTRYQPTRPTKLPKPLPPDLETVAAASTTVKVRITDPVTNAPYEYTPKGNSYELCATFDLSRDLNYDIFWNHPAGHYCFEFDALDLSSK